MESTGPMPPRKTTFRLCRIVRYLAIPEQSNSRICCKFRDQFLEWWSLEEVSDYLIGDGVCEFTHSLSSCP